MTSKNSEPTGSSLEDRDRGTTWPRAGVLALLLFVLTTLAAQAQFPLLAGDVPHINGRALVVLREGAGPVQIVGELRARGCAVGAMATTESGVWRVFVPDASAQVRTAFPQSLDAATPILVRCLDDPPPRPYSPLITESGTVNAVTDGDTLQVLVEGARPERVRLVGIDTPEVGECLASAARIALTDLTAGRAVRLERDIDDRDSFGRLLRHVFVGEVHVNEAQVRAGLALARPVYPNTARASELQTSESAARLQGVGIWNREACGPSTMTTIGVSHIEYNADGDDGQNLNGEWVELRNEGPEAAVLTGWALKDNSASHRFDFPDGFTLPSGASVRVHSGCGAQVAAELHWCVVGSAIWNNDGDSVFLLDSYGNIAAVRSYGIR